MAVGGLGVAAGWCYVDADARKNVLIASGGAASHAVMRGLNSLSVHNAHHLHDSLRRPPGVGLLTVSNHKATCDDPQLLAALVPPAFLLRGASQYRWGVCAKDVCFKEGHWLSYFADACKVLPIDRTGTTGGVWQPEIDAIIRKLRAGEWVHYFPEGRIKQDGEVHMFRRGVGRLVAAVRQSERLRVLPFYIHGTDVLQPSAHGGAPPSLGPGTVLTRPQLGTPLHVIFGAPVDLSAYVAMQDQPPFDKRPELLFEIIAHVLEEEVRALQRELERRLARGAGQPEPAQLAAQRGAAAAG
ncbi:hypothetical protein AB1Y20_022772 [Prymnesium parvum]|uniref:Tafazzin family protein n=1 Tax=Prymnesium parvum TaxID=97485 RepID=A0AB34JI39_PRYPA